MVINLSAKSFSIEAAKMPAMEYESEYGIEILNRFAGLDLEADDPLELVERAQQKEKALKADKKQAKTKKGNVKAQEKAPSIITKDLSIDDSKKDGFKSDKPERQDRGDRGGRGRGGRGGRGRGGRGRGGFDRDRPPRENRGEQKENGFGSQENQDNGESKPFGGERRGFGGERRGFGGERRGFGGERRGFGGERRGFGERKGFGSGFSNDNEQGIEKQGFGGGFGNDSGEGDGFGKRGGRGFSRPRGRGRGRGGRGREFDRHSGSDRSSVKPTDKRDGSGSYNWGTPGDEIEGSSVKPTDKRDGLGSYNTGGLLDGQMDASDETNMFSNMEGEVKGSWADNAEETENQGESSDEQNQDAQSSPKPEEPKEMTLDEYKALMAKETSAQTFNVRQANEGEKNPPKNVVALKKLSEEDQEQDGSLFFPRRIIEEKIKTSGRVKEHLQFDLKYAAVDSRLTSGPSGRGARRGRGGRGGRGGGGGSGGARRGGGFGSRDGGDKDERAGFEKDVAINEQYDSNFPSL